MPVARTVRFFVRIRSNGLLPVQPAAFTRRGSIPPFANDHTTCPATTSRISLGPVGVHTRASPGIQNVDRSRPAPSPATIAGIPSTAVTRSSGIRRSSFNVNCSGLNPNIDTSVGPPITSGSPRRSPVNMSLM